MSFESLDHRTRNIVDFTLTHGHNIVREIVLKNNSVISSDDTEGVFKSIQHIADEAVARMAEKIGNAGSVQMDLKEIEEIIRESCWNDIVCMILLCSV